MFQSERFFSDCDQTKDQIKYLRKKCRSVFKRDTNFREISSVQEETQIFQLMYISLFFTEKWHFLLLNHQICKDKIHNL